VVRFLASECGIRQFLDIGTGLPTASNTHEVAQAAAPEARIVYVDSDPIVLAHAKALLTSTPEGATAYLDADLRDTSAIARAASRTLDFGEPVALMLLIILHLIPDTDDPYGIVARLVSALPAGSYLVLAHPASDIHPAEMAEMTRRVNERMSGPKATMRDRAAITRFFDGLELLEPRCGPASAVAARARRAQPASGDSLVRRRPQAVADRARRRTYCGSAGWSTKFTVVSSRSPLRLTARAASCTFGALSLLNFGHGDLLWDKRYAPARQVSRQDADGNHGRSPEEKIATTATA
jgi:S-adenosyl methyltransferase